MGTLSKAFGSCGGYVAGSRDAIGRVADVVGCGRFAIPPRGPPP
jgi:hypothetical protein